jgi:hypothetical protein
MASLRAMKLLLRLGIVVAVAAFAAMAVFTYKAVTMFEPPDPVVTTTPVPGLGVVRETFHVQPSLPDSSTHCEYELLHVDGRTIPLGQLSTEDRACALQRPPVVDKGALILTSNVGYIVWRDGAPAHVVRENCRLLVSDTVDARAGSTCLFALDPQLEIGEGDEPWTLRARHAVQFTSTDHGQTWLPATPFARTR